MKFWYKKICKRITPSIYLSIHPSIYLFLHPSIHKSSIYLTMNPTFFTFYLCFSNISIEMSLAKFSHLEEIELSACSIQTINPQLLAGYKISILTAYKSTAVGSCCMLFYISRLCISIYVNGPYLLNVRFKKYDRAFIIDT